LSKILCSGCGSNKARRRGLCARCGRGTPVPLTPAQALQSDREKMRVTAELANLRLRYQAALRTIGSQEEELDTLGVLGRSVETHVIQPAKIAGKNSTSEATVVLVASDWHVEEEVGAEVGGLNRYSLDIARSRSSTFFAAGLRLIKLLQQDVKIHTAVLALLGDFISGQIHGAESAEKNSHSPTDAIVEAQNMIISGIEFLLAHSDLKLVIPCASGNHARTSLTTRFGAENGHSLEYLMYLHLAAYFRNEPRVTFIIPEGMHSYVQVYDQTIRFHHGHAVKYGGGVGGIYIPVNKAIAQWNKGRHADLDVFGHFHQLRDGGNFICNGSMIGYNSFALSIKADYEPPKQVLFLIDKKRGRTCTWPILFKE
jgi:hypothetical protein